MLRGLLERLREDVQVVFERDPAARSVLEVILCYPGLHALWLHRIAHWFYRRRLYLIARLISHFGRWLTGIEIHPGARIGRRCFIDHGMGVVIGETAEIGDDVTIYQGVTLGGTGKERGKRHPTLGNGVLVGVGAKVLGAITVGDNSRIGAGAVVVKPVPPNCTVVGIPGKVVIRDGRRVGIDLNHGELPDPVSEAIQKLQHYVEELEQRVITLERELAAERQRSARTSYLGG
ncbi:MAG: serine O-acetyltransferase [Symbiobacteriaceae bacterium]|nr:MAG: serine O-acetyltransferase [Bacillota bacterium]